METILSILDMETILDRLIGVPNAITILYSLAYIIVIALAVNTIFAIPLYKTYTPDKKPFNCIFCMAFWIGVLIGAITYITPLPLIYWLGVTLATPYLSALLKKISDNLPTHF